MQAQESTIQFLREIGNSFELEKQACLRLQFILDRLPNTTPEETWTALPMLFLRGTLNPEELQSMPYLEFLQTPYWTAVSEHVKSKHPWCALCTDPLSGPLEVHHRTYVHRGYEWRHLNDLAVLCHECHDWISKKPARWKAVPRQ
jgi:hypothetical protein